MNSRWNNICIPIYIHGDEDNEMNANIFKDDDQSSNRDSKSIPWWQRVLRLLAQRHHAF
jgi:hypothetical protein